MKRQKRRDPLQRVLKARSQAVYLQPFFGTLLLYLKLIVDTTCKTFWTDGKSLGFNPAFAESLSFAEVIGVMVHEVLHNAMMHHTRRGDRDPKLWNIACDYAINCLVIQAGLQLPAGHLRDARYDGRSAEWIYDQLLKEQQQQQQQQQQSQQPGAPSQSGSGQSGQGDPSEIEPGEIGEVRDFPGDADEAGDDASASAGDKQGDKPDAGKGKGKPGKGKQPTASEISQEEQQWKVRAVQAAAIARKAGKLPADMDRRIKKLLEPVLSWEEILSRFLTEVNKNDYTWMKPNPRYMQAGTYLPSLYNEELGEIAILVDTSGSISNAMINRFATEVQFCLATYDSPYEIKVAYVDSKYQDHDVMRAGDIAEDVLNPKGGGGTDFRPGFEWLEEEGDQPTAILYFTDGCCNSFPDEPDSPVLWVVHGREDFEPPFGEVAYMPSQMDAEPF